MNEIQTADIYRFLGECTGLLIGPGMTIGRGASQSLLEAFKIKSTDPTSGSYPESIFTATREIGDVDSARGRLNAFFGAQSASLALRQLALGHWNAVLSASLDSIFETMLREEHDRRPNREPVAVIDDLNRAVPQRVVPVFKLLGSIVNPDAAISKMQYLRRKVSWAGAIRNFVELTRGSHLLCLGLEESPELVSELVVLFATERNRLPKSIAFFGDDPLLQNQDLVGLIESVGRLTVIQAPSATLGQLKQIAQVVSPQPIPGTTNPLDLTPYRHLAVLVNSHIAPQAKKSERNRLYDALFSPGLANWDPFSFNMDFPRTATRMLLDDLKLLQTPRGKDGNMALAVVGAVATGKSVIGKRVAYEVAKLGFPVVWLRQVIQPDNSQIFLEVLRRIRNAFPEKRVFVIMDDPTGFVGISPRDIKQAAEATRTSVALIVTARSSEWSVLDRTAFTGGMELFQHYDLPEQFDGPELSRLPDYLAALGLYPNKSLAETALRAVASRTRAADTLSTLYWLLPDTKKSISQSVADEYFRLGDVGGLSRVLIGAVHKTSKVLKDAYELVAVANRYGSALPIEILVEALGVSYSDWLDATAAQTTAWGILYADGNPKSEGAAYRTRSSIVTDILISTINGGAASRGGEIRLLERLLRACSGTSPLYREFAVRILVRDEKLKDLSIQQTLQLFDAAIASLPFADRTLLHQKAIWLRKAGRSLEALPLLERALGSDQYPYATQIEPDEHIHNSSAATYLELIDQKLVGLEDGKLHVMEHLSRARSTRFFNAFTAHVQANLIVKLLDHMKATDRVDISALTARALSDLEVTLAAYRGYESSQISGQSENVSMLLGIRSTLLGRLRPLDELEADAEEQWIQHRSQNGYVVLARKLLHDAQQSGKGSDYKRADTAATSAIAKVAATHSAVDPGLAECALHIYYAWRIQRRISTRAMDNIIDWERIRELSAVALQARRGAQDSFNRYLHALSLAQLGRWPDSTAVFAELRKSQIPNDLLWMTRDYLLDKNGSMMKVQGEVRRQGDRLFLWCPDLGTDFRADRAASWRTGEQTHAYVAFAYAGPTAVPPSTVTAK